MIEASDDILSNCHLPHFVEDLTVIILTFNEEAHIERCIRSAKHIASRIIVVDSGSTDATIELASANGASVFYNRW
ncbi:MAG: hypothetical protein CFE32_21190, partial [Alphaproteobacteria bacterium PA3]